MKQKLHRILLRHCDKLHEWSQALFKFCNDCGQWRGGQWSTTHESYSELKKKEKCSNYNVFSNALQQKLQVTNGMKKWVQLFSWRTLYTQGKLSIVDVRRDTKCRYIVSKNNSNTITERVFSECHNSPFVHLSKSITEDRATASFRKEKQTNKQKQRVE